MGSAKNHIQTKLERDRGTEIYRMWVRGARSKVTEVYKAKDREMNGDGWPQAKLLGHFKEKLGKRIF
jgi:hypothetical protein